MSSEVDSDRVDETPYKGQKEKPKKVFMFFNIDLSDKVLNQKCNGDDRKKEPERSDKSTLSLADELDNESPEIHIKSVVKETGTQRNHGGGLMSTFSRSCASLTLPNIFYIASHSFENPSSKYNRYQGGCKKAKANDFSDTLNALNIYSKKNKLSNDMYLDWRNMCMNEHYPYKFNYGQESSMEEHESVDDLQPSNAKTNSLKYDEIPYRVRIMQRRNSSKYKPTNESKPKSYMGSKHKANSAPMYSRNTDTNLKANQLKGSNYSYELNSDSNVEPTYNICPKKDAKYNLKSEPRYIPKNASLKPKYNQHTNTEPNYNSSYKLSYDANFEPNYNSFPNAGSQFSYDTEANYNFRPDPSMGPNYSTRAEQKYNGNIVKVECDPYNPNKESNYSYEQHFYNSNQNTQPQCNQTNYNPGNNQSSKYNAHIEDNSGEFYGRMYNANKSLHCNSNIPVRGMNTQYYGTQNQINANSCYGSHQQWMPDAKFAEIRNIDSSQLTNSFYGIDDKSSRRPRGKAASPASHEYAYNANQENVPCTFKKQRQTSFQIEAQRQASGCVDKECSPTSIPNRIPSHRNEGYNQIPQVPCPAPQPDLYIYNKNNESRRPPTTINSSCAPNEYIHPSVPSSQVPHERSQEYANQLSNMQCSVSPPKQFVYTSNENTANYRTPPATNLSAVSSGCVTKEFEYSPTNMPQHIQYQRSEDYNPPAPMQRPVSPTQEYAYGTLRPSKSLASSSCLIKHCEYCGPSYQMPQTQCIISPPQQYVNNENAIIQGSPSTAISSIEFTNPRLLEENGEIPHRSSRHPKITFEASVENVVNSAEKLPARNPNEWDIPYKKMECKCDPNDQCHPIPVRYGSGWDYDRSKEVTHPVLRAQQCVEMPKISCQQSCHSYTSGYQSQTSLGAVPSRGDFSEACQYICRKSLRHKISGFLKKSKHNLKKFRKQNKSLEYDDPIYYEATAKPTPSRHTKSALGYLQYSTTEPGGKKLTASTALYPTNFRNKRTADVDRNLSHNRYIMLNKRNRYQRPKTNNPERRGGGTNLYSTQSGRLMNARGPSVSFENVPHATATRDSHTPVQKSANIQPKTPSDLNVHLTIHTTDCKLAKPPTIISHSSEPDKIITLAADQNNDNLVMSSGSPSPSHYQPNEPSEMYRSYPHCLPSCLQMNDNLDLRCYPNRSPLPHPHPHQQQYNTSDMTSCYPNPAPPPQQHSNSLDNCCLPPTTAQQNSNFINCCCRPTPFAQPRTENLSADCLDSSQSTEQQQNEALAGKKLLVEELKQELLDQLKADAQAAAVSQIAAPIYGPYGQEIIATGNAAPQLPQCYDSTNLKMWIPGSTPAQQPLASFPQSSL
ncbi:uncharacterized protein LOC115630521 [Scaptodrosophila lebanonensis]|uniref:Uncharacterized protein LOC115630521 n=1 Tax=Drosophila lebanonensis TaxID=7225 RepID=A0A6J2U4X2_DROLE|nr:uncharacterized protein LOC115630521 [Scaptodrosophila lebanonensis]